MSWTTFGLTPTGCKYTSYDFQSLQSSLKCSLPTSYTSIDRSLFGRHTQTMTPAAVPIKNEEKKAKKVSRHRAK